MKLLHNLILAALLATISSASQAQTSQNTVTPSAAAQQTPLTEEQKNRQIIDNWHNLRAGMTWDQVEAQIGPLNYGQAEALMKGLCQNPSINGGTKIENDKVFLVFGQGCLLADFRIKIGPKQ
jgi:hypothetical protein